MAKVLIVEDDLQLRQTVRMTLKQQGFCCDEAANGWDGLQKMCEATAAHAPFDLVLLDIVMPKVDGWEFLQAVKANPLWAKTRVVVVSGRAISAKDVAKVTAMDCLHVEKKSGFIESLTQMLTRITAHAQ